MYTLNTATAIKKMTVNELRDFIFEKYYQGIGFVKESSPFLMKRLKRKDFLLLSTKVIEKIADSTNAKGIIF